MTPVQPVESASQSVKPAAQSVKPLHRLEWYPEMPAYPGYKPSGVEWLGDVPEHWGVKRGRCITILC